MAVNFATAPTTIQQLTAPFYALTGAIETKRDASSISSGDTTPYNSSPTSPRNISSTSPTNLRNPCLSRQLRPPKAPLYVPAVLRPTERPAKYCRQQSSSATSTTKVSGDAASLLTPPSTPSTSFDSKDGIQVTDEGVFRRLLNEDIARAGVSRIVTDEWNDDLLEDVTGTPTRDHWKPDFLSNSCDTPTCRTPFTFLNRRHHCRRCGNIFCAPHSSHTVPLDQHARFHPKGSPGRACDACYADYNAWRKARRERGSVSTESSSQGSGSGAATPRVDGEGIPVRGMGGRKGPEPPVGSVPRDWTWSTF